MVPGLVLESCPGCLAHSGYSRSAVLRLQLVQGRGAQQNARQGLRPCRPAQPLRLCTGAAVAAPEKQAIKLDVTKMEPLGDRLLVKPNEAEKTTAGGLLLAGGTTQSIQEAIIGKVIAVGEDIEIQVKAGDTVIYSKYSTTDVKTPEGDISFVAQKSILATLS